jgi:hypothetical protein
VNQEGHPGALVEAINWVEGDVLWLFGGKSFDGNDD